jgi:hypothetical protein
MRSSPVRSLLAATGLALVTSGPLQAQATGGFVTRLGVDTVALERFTRTADRLEGDVVQFRPRVRAIHYRVDWASAGAVRQFEIEQRTPGDTAPPVTLTLVFDADSIRTTRVQGERRTQRAVPGRAGVRPHALYLWALYELETETFARAPADSMEFWLVSTSGPAIATMFRRTAPDTLSTVWFLPGYHLDYAFAPDGRLLGLNGLNTTVKVLVERVASVPFEQALARAVARERSAGPAGPVSPHDSVTADLGGTIVTVVYGRPVKRGRTVWGGVVPFDQVWRTGADAATSFTVSGPVTLGGTSVPAGSYSLYSLPTGSGATLIVNRQVGQWGTEYHPEQDLVRIPVTVERLTSPIQSFTIGVRESPSGAALVFEWDQLRWLVPIAPERSPGSD